MSMGVALTNLCFFTSVVTNWKCTQTGYKSHPVGLILYVLTLLTCVGFQGVLMMLTILYYRADNPAKVNTNWSPFASTAQALYVFECVWMVGLAYCGALKWPGNISNLFLRRCEFAEADTVVVYEQDTTPLVINDESIILMKKVQRVVPGLIPHP